MTGGGSFCDPESAVSRRPRCARDGHGRLADTVILAQHSRPCLPVCDDCFPFWRSCSPAPPSLKARPASTWTPWTPPSGPRTTCSATSTAPGWRPPRSRATGRATAPSTCCASSPRRTCAPSSRTRRPVPSWTPTPARSATIYTAYMDSTRIEDLGIAPLQPDFDRIDAIASGEDLARYFAQNRGAYGPAPVSAFVTVDPKNSDRHILTLWQSGTGLPDRSYYLEDRFADARDGYVAYLTQLYELAGWEGGAEAAQAILDLETRIAQIQWTRIQNRDPEARYNPTSTADLIARHPNTHYDVMLATLGIGVDSADRRPAAVPGRAGQLDGRGPARDVEDLRPRADAQRGRRRAPVRFRRGQLRLLRPHPQRTGRGPSALEEGRRRHVRRARRGHRPDLRRPPLPAGGRRPDGRADREPARRLPDFDQRQPVDDRRHQGRGARQARELRLQDWPPDRVGGLLDAGGLAHRPDRQRPRDARLGPRRQHREAGRGTRPLGVGHDAADRQRVLQPGLQRDRLPGRHPAAAVLQRRGGRRGQLRRHRRRHRPRVLARLRRLGQPVRRAGQPPRLVDRGRPDRVRRPRRHAGRAVRRLRALPGRQRPGPPHVRARTSATCRA